ncbi:carbohydrate ABC transporter permease [Paracoccus sp. Z118]|uniref:carbohydrate ABC transporter permease n=1 Tax=Paracoccus sp. Z118 TaxID=2851017 RepID=UPI001C2C7CEB|nr:carbohydrate ABC transporter permease [Paracoccus sp. Z118]MBV0892562.1 carbohydrate ABC transporter permease [Paracoccus sp. Z118]
MSDRSPRVPPLRAIAALVLLVNGLFPAIWILLTSLKSEPELSRTPITYLPEDPTFQNYVTAFSDQPLHLFLFNSFAVATLSTISTLFVSTLAAYALARLNLRFRGVILMAIIGVSTFPLVTLLVPLFEIMRGLGLLNTWAALIIPYTVLSLPVCTLVLAAFFESVPRDLENAAMIDGCTRVGALFRVIVPLSAPGVFTAAILAFVNAWDEFLLALSFNSNPALRTLPVGIQLYQGEFTFPWPVISAALVVGIVPLAILIVLFQERVVSGLMTGGVKG